MYEIHTTRLFYCTASASGGIIVYQFKIAMYFDFWLGLRRSSISVFPTGSGFCLSVRIQVDRSLSSLVQILYVVYGSCKSSCHGHNVKEQNRTEDIIDRISP